MNDSIKKFVINKTKTLSYIIDGMLKLLTPAISIKYL